MAPIKWLHLEGQRTEFNNQHLNQHGEEPNEDKLAVLVQAIKDIELVVHLAGIDLIEDLLRHNHKDTSHLACMNTKVLKTIVKCTDDLVLWPRPDGISSHESAENTMISKTINCNAE